MAENTADARAALRTLHQGNHGAVCVVPLDEAFAKVAWMEQAA